MMVRKSKGLGERHQRILDFLSEYQRENRYPPSIREIGNKTGITSTSVVNYYLDQLEKKGMIERDRKISRGVRLSGVNGSADTLRVPILGPIAAGLPLPIYPPPGLLFSRTLRSPDTRLSNPPASSPLVTSNFPPWAGVSTQFLQPATFRRPPFFLSSRPWKSITSYPYLLHTIE